MRPILLLCLILSGMAQAYAFPRHEPVPGGTAIIPLIPVNEIKPRANFQNRRVSVAPHGNYWHAVIGIPLNTKPGQYQVQYHVADQVTQTRSFDVAAKDYQTQHLTVKNKRKVNPTAEDMKRIRLERVRKTRAKQTWSDIDITTDFMWPVSGRISSVFGLRRFFNEQPRRPHTGLDIAAPEGTPIKAVADATVIETGDFFFSGNMIYLDHGQGLITLYAHLSRVDVKPGQQIKQGDIIGAVGQTGRVTGPHLHMSIILNETVVDPIHWLPSRI